MPLIRNGTVTQDEITEALFDFYKGYYPGLSDDAILDGLQQGMF